MKNISLPTYRIYSLDWCTLSIIYSALFNRISYKFFISNMLNAKTFFFLSFFFHFFEQEIISDKWRKWLAVFIEVGALYSTEKHAVGLDTMEQYFTGAGKGTRSTAATPANGARCCWSPRSSWRSSKCDRCHRPISRDHSAATAAGNAGTGSTGSRTGSNARCSWTGAPGASRTRTPRAWTSGASGTWARAAAYGGREIASAGGYQRTCCCRATEDLLCTASSTGMLCEKFYKYVV